MSRITSGQEKERRPQAFTAATQKIAGDLGNRLEGGTTLSRQLLFDEDEVISNEIENLPGGEQRDGLPPARNKSTRPRTGQYPV
jgi:hypothetical protein